MARYQFDEKDTPSASVADVANGVLDILVRLAGLVLLCIGLWTAVAIIKEAWALYQNPNNGAVERFAQAIDQGSHLDRLLSPKRLSNMTGSIAGTGGNPASEFGAGAAPEASPDAAVGAAAAKPPTPSPADTQPEEPLKLSYFMAWAILLLVMLLVGRLSLAAIKTGGELALHDVQLKRFARQLLREMNRGRET